MQPALEVVGIGTGESFKAWEHGYPFHTVRWHFHPEYEIHHVVASSGRCFIGDYIGTFEPGNLMLTGPNLPHNWVSSLAAGQTLPLRSRVVQFSERFVESAMVAMPELCGLRETLERSRRGVQFTRETARRAGPMMAELVAARGLRRLELFIGILHVLTTDPERRMLTSGSYHPDPSGFMSTGINEALAFIGRNLTEPFSETDLAQIAGLSPGAFSRSFRRHTGLSLVRYVNRLRIALACQFLMEDERMKVAEVCFESGFNNLSNFNRQFMAQKGMAPSQFRAASAGNAPPATSARERRTA